MSAAAFLTELRAAGVTLAVNGDRLKVEAAPGILTPIVIARLKAAKPELMAILADDAAANDDTEAGPDLPLLAAIHEFDDLIERLCDLRRYDDETRGLMRATKLRMSCESVCAELPIIRQHVEAAKLARRGAA